MSQINLKSICASIQRTLRNKGIETTSEEITQVILEICGSVEEYTDTQRPAILDKLISLKSQITPVSANQEEEKAELAIPPKSQANLPTITDSPTNITPHVSTPNNLSTETVAPNQPANYGQPNKETIQQDAINKATALQNSLERLTEYELAVSNKAITEAVTNAVQSRNEKFKAQDDQIAGVVDTIWSQNREFFRTTTNTLDNLFI
jgi:hypothetical protein